MVTKECSPLIQALAKSSVKPTKKLCKKTGIIYKAVGLEELLLLTGQQSIAQRGHTKNDENVNTGNFLGLLKLINNHDPIVAQNCVNLPKNAKYTSPKIQNEVLQLLADMIRKQIIEEVKSSEHFALIVDETKDISKTEQISFVFRYFWHGCVHESFL